MDGRRTSRPNYNYRHRQQHQIFFITKCDNLITKCDRYHKKRQFDYKVRHAATTKHDGTEDRCNFCHNQFKGLSVAI